MVFVMKLRLMSWAQSEITADIHALDDGLTKETEEESSFFWVSSSRKGNKKGTDEKKTGKKKKISNRHQRFVRDFLDSESSSSVRGCTDCHQK